MLFAGVTGVGAMGEMGETLAMTHTMINPQVAQTAIGKTTENPESPIMATDIVTPTMMKDTTDPDHGKVCVSVSQNIKFDSVWFALLQDP